MPRTPRALVTGLDPTPSRRSRLGLPTAPAQSGQTIGKVAGSATPGMPPPAPPAPPPSGVTVPSAAAGKAVPFGSMDSAVELSQLWQLPLSETLQYMSDVTPRASQDPGARQVANRQTESALERRAGLVDPEELRRVDATGQPPETPLHPPLPLEETMRLLQMLRQRRADPGAR